MKRRSMSRTMAEEQGEQGFWPSYADMMSAIALILFFLMLLSYIQNLITGNDLQSTQEALASTRTELSDAQDRLTIAVKEAEDAEKLLSQVSLQLEDAQLTLSEQEKVISGYALQIAGQEETIAAQEDLIGQQKEYLAAANAELVDMRNQMQTIAVLRLSILEQIRESIESVMGDGATVSIGDNGSIILSEGVLFDVASSEIKPDSRTVLNRLIDVFNQFLSDEENVKYIDSIVISGHTDITGTAESNRVLSTDRANSVLNYLLTGSGGKLNKYASYFCAAGYGATRPVASNDTVDGRSANRRIEISMILKDETVLDIVEQYLALELPETGMIDTETTAPEATAPEATVPEAADPRS